MGSRAVIITGVNGGIGQALAATFHSAGWAVVGTDVGAEAIDPDKLCLYRSLDLATVATEEGAARRFMADLADALPDDTPLGCLINNAAFQRLGATGAVTHDDWTQSLNINLTAPFFLSQAFLDHAIEAPVIINITSVHAQATKPTFVAYATSKAALSGLTRAMAVDIGSRARVVGIAPAAIATPMLIDGFKEHEDKFQELAHAHPSGRIGKPQEVAAAALFLAGPDAAFMTGTVLGCDGGIMARLHDPV